MAINQPQDDWAEAIESTATRNRVVRYVEDLFAALPDDWLGRSLLTVNGLQIKVRNADYSRVMIFDIPLEPSTTPAALSAMMRDFIASQTDARKTYMVA